VEGAYTRENTATKWLQRGSLKIAPIYDFLKNFRKFFVAKSHYLVQVPSEPLKDAFSVLVLW
jgi:hypothetical protein